ncbi:MAG: DNA repair protein RecN [Trueperella sp.]|nr:DNA repair protein RecN [Trueperella sp.]
MLEELRIRNVGVIEQADVAFRDGMTAITGETGAGKTMALTSLGLLMGAKADPKSVRAGSAEAKVEGTFLVSQNSPAVEILRNAGGEVDLVGDKAAIIISRQVPVTGRSRAYAGGQSVPLALLQELAQYLVTVHGQADQLRLRAPAQHRRALDRFGGVELETLKREYASQFARLTELRAEVERFRADAAQAATERLALQALIKRVDAVQPKVGEDEELRKQAELLDNVEDLRSSLVAARNALDQDGENGAIAGLEIAYQSVNRAVRYDESLSGAAEELQSAVTAASEALNQLATAANNLTADPDQLDKIHSRRAEILGLQRELAMTVPEILARRASAADRLTALTEPQKHLAELEQKLQGATAVVHESGQQLTELRRKVGEKLGKQVTAELHALAMKDATFTVELSARSEPAAHGLDDVQFLLTPHRAAPAQPLATSASGGEISRIMLALEVCLAENVGGEIGTYIFDEVDAGIGGKTALSVGQRLARLGTGTQVLVVTHLAQVAAYAEHHVVVTKISDNQAVTALEPVTGAEREIELARMLSGHDDLVAARTHAAELLRAATVQ